MISPSPAFVLRATAQKLRDNGKERWVKGTLAADKNGYGVMPNSADACAWCATGLMRTLFTTQANYDAEEAFVQIRGVEISELNDTHGYEAIIAWLEVTASELETVPTDAPQPDPVPPKLTKDDLKIFEEILLYKLYTETGSGQGELIRTKYLNTLYQVREMMKGT